MKNKWKSYWKNLHTFLACQLNWYAIIQIIKPHEQLKILTCLLFLVTYHTHAAFYHNHDMWLIFLLNIYFLQFLQWLTSSRSPSYVSWEHMGVTMSTYIQGIVDVSKNHNSQYTCIKICSSRMWVCNFLINGLVCHNYKEEFIISLLQFPIPFPNKNFKSWTNWLIWHTSWN